MYQELDVLKVFILFDTLIPLLGISPKEINGNTDKAKFVEIFIVTL